MPDTIYTVALLDQSAAQDAKTQDRAATLLRGHRDALDGLITRLLEVETIWRRTRRSSR